MKKLFFAILVGLIGPIPIPMRLSVSPPAPKVEKKWTPDPEHWKSESPSVYKNYNNVVEYAKFRYQTAKEFERRYNIPREFYIAKSWHETRGGKAGVGRRGGIYGIKGKGHKGYDKVDAAAGHGKVEYQAYKEHWEAYSHFSKLLLGKNPMYLQRFNAWIKQDPSIDRAYAWALALQVHPNRKYSRSAYALCGCADGRREDCYMTRLASAKRVMHLIDSVRQVPGYLE